MVNLAKRLSLYQLESLIAKEAEQMGYTRQNITFEFSHGDKISHGYAKDSESIVISGNMATGQINVRRRG